MKKWYELNNSSLYLEPQALCGTLPLRWQEPGLGIQLLHLRCILASTCHPRKLPAPADPQELTFWSWGAGWSVEPKLLSPLPYFWFIKNRTLEKILDTVHNGIKLDSFLLGGKNGCPALVRSSEKHRRKFLCRGYIFAFDFPCSLVGKQSACNAGDQGSIPGLGRFLRQGNGNPLQYSCLENPRDRGVWRATVHGIARVGPDLATEPPPSIVEFPPGSPIQSPGPALCI